MPIINNGKFYINPAHGRALERARIVQAARNAVPGHREQEQEQSGHWVTINGRHVLMDEAQAERTARSARDRIAATAKKYDGSTKWGFDKQKGNFAPGTNKCNKFVYDVTKEAGAEATVIGSDGKPRPPLAGEWADTNTPFPAGACLGRTRHRSPVMEPPTRLPGAAYTTRDIPGS